MSAQTQAVNRSMQNQRAQYLLLCFNENQQSISTRTQAQISVNYQTCMMSKGTLLW